MKKHRCNRTSQRSALNDRLTDNLVLEICQDGTVTTSVMTLRHLYSAVMRVISNKPVGRNNPIDPVDEKESLIPARATLKVIGREVSEVSVLTKHRGSYCGGNGGYDLLDSTDVKMLETRTNNDIPVSEDLINVEKVHDEGLLPECKTDTEPDDSLPKPPSFVQANSLPGTVGKSNMKSFLQGAVNAMNIADKIQKEVEATYRERLGGYLHPRDMRRLVTPFSPTNEPALIVRRHVMLLNFDPLRAIVLRDRLLLLVPDGADSILSLIETRMKGGIAEMENQVFGDKEEESYLDPVSPPPKGPAHPMFHISENNGNDFSENEDEKTDEWNAIQHKEWIKMPFEFSSVDTVLVAVLSLLEEDFSDLEAKMESAVSMLRGETQSKGPKLNLQDTLRQVKDETKSMEGRVQGFIRAINLVLDNDEDMTLMNLSRLITHPTRFVQPVAQKILDEESDEPELILEVHLQEALSILNNIQYMKQRISNTEDQLSMKMDSIRNRLLFINTLLGLGSTCIASASLVGAFFGMNFQIPGDGNPNMFAIVVITTLGGTLFLACLLIFVFWNAGFMSGMVG